jgi:hypothetical protein
VHCVINVGIHHGFDVDTRGGKHGPVQRLDGRILKVPSQIVGADVSRDRAQF